MLQVVWLKRDLRWEDHAPLRAALATAKPVVVLVLHEPSIWSSPVYSNRHARFVWESVSELRKTAPLVGASSHEPRGPQPIPVFHLWAEVQEAFEALESLAGIPLSAVHSHQEVGIACTYDRYRSIKKWLDHREIPWI